MPAPYFILLIDTDPLLIKTLEGIAADTFPGVTFRQFCTAGEAQKSIASDSAQLPDAIWFSINLLDRHNELEFLAWLRASSVTRSLPVMLLADGILTCDVVDSYTFSATSFALRPFSKNDWESWLDGQMKLVYGG